MAEKITVIQKCTLKLFGLEKPSDREGTQRSEDDYGPDGDGQTGFDAHQAHSSQLDHMVEGVLGFGSGNFLALGFGLETNKRGLEGVDHERAVIGNDSPALQGPRFLDDVFGVAFQFATQFAAGGARDRELTSRYKAAREAASLSTLVEVSEKACQVATAIRPRAMP